MQAAERGQLDIAIPGNAYVQFQNAASIDSYGFNAALDGSFIRQRFLYAINVTEAHARARDPETSSQPLSARPAAGAYDTAFEPTPFAPTRLDLRLTASGKVSPVKGLSYRLSIDHIVGERSSYVIGPQIRYEGHRSAELAPIAPFRGSIGLEYSFLDD